MKAEFLVVSDPRVLEKVENPHFTFHPALVFHLKSNDQRSGRDEDLFSGICDVGIVLQQQSEMPWLRITTAPLSGLKSADASSSQGALILAAPGENMSIRLSVDFIGSTNSQLKNGPMEWYLSEGPTNLRVTAALTYPSIATLAWFHFY